MKEKEFEFTCNRCWDDAEQDDFKFKTKDWYANERKDGPHDILYVDLEAKCPKCNCCCYKSFSSSDMLEMIFELQEEIKKLKKEE